MKTKLNTVIRIDAAVMVLAVAAFILGKIAYGDGRGGFWSMSREFGGLFVMMGAAAVVLVGALVMIVCLIVKSKKK